VGVAMIGEFCAAAAGSVVGAVGGRACADTMALEERARAAQMSKRRFMGLLVGRVARVVR